jgi:hypothetical protein
LANNYHFSEDFILWHLPYHRALRYIHAALWSNGAWTVKSKPAPKAEYEKLLSIALEAQEDDES